METIAKLPEQIVADAYEKHRLEILGYIRYKIVQKEEAEDLLQDVFIRVLDYSQMLRENTILSFLFTIARNIVIDFNRRHARRQVAFDYIYETRGEYDFSVTEHVHAQELMDLEQKRLQQFPAQRKLIYSLSRYDEKSVPEIAEILQISKRTVENHLLIGRKEMRDYIKCCI